MLPEEFYQTGIVVRGIRCFSSTEALLLCRLGAVLLDIRPEHETAYKQFDVPCMEFVPVREAGNLLPLLEPGKYYIVADASGIKSRDMVIHMTGMGFQHVASLPGGMLDWDRQGAPVRVDNNRRLTGSCMCQLKARKKD